MIFVLKCCTKLYFYTLIIFILSLKSLAVYPAVAAKNKRITALPCDIKRIPFKAQRQLKIIFHIFRIHVVPKYFFPQNNIKLCGHFCDLFICIFSFIHIYRYVLFIST